MGSAPTRFRVCCGQHANFRADELLFGQISRGSTAWARSRIGCKPWSRARLRPAVIPTGIAKLLGVDSWPAAPAALWRTRHASREPNKARSTAWAPARFAHSPTLTPVESHRQNLRPPRRAGAPLRVRLVTLRVPDSERGAPAGRSPGDRARGHLRMFRAHSSRPIFFDAERHSPPTEAGVENRAFAT
jgi:hypothetical protein